MREEVYLLRLVDLDIEPQPPRKRSDGERTPPRVVQGNQSADGRYAFIERYSFHGNLQDSWKVHAASKRVLEKAPRDWRGNGGVRA